jgi:hypothetical protein
VWSPGLGFENNFALIVRREDAARWNLRRISDLVGHEKEIRPGFGYEFVERQDGLAGLARAYGLAFALRPVEMDLGLLYAALESRKVDLIAGNSTDGLIAALDAVVLEDDRRYFPPYEAAFVVEGKLWRGNRAVREVLEGLGSSIDAAEMRGLNAAIDRDKRRPEDVAREFLARRRTPSARNSANLLSTRTPKWKDSDNARPSPDLFAGRLGAAVRVRGPSLSAGHLLSVPLDGLLPVLEDHDGRFVEARRRDPRVQGRRQGRRSRALPRPDHPRGSQGGPGGDPRHGRDSPMTRGQVCLSVNFGKLT